MTSLLESIDQVEYLKKNEALLVKQIDNSLEKYVSGLGIGYVSHTPPSTDQNFKDLDKYCGDIVAALGNISALILEVKFNHGGSLNDLNSDQNSGLIELRGRGVPVFYSYNVDEFSRLPKGAAQQLRFMTAIEPRLQINKKAITYPEYNLKAAVDHLINMPTEHDGLAVALASFVDAEENIMNSGVEKLTTKALLLIYDHNTCRLACLSKEAVLYVIQRVINGEYLAESKKSAHLAVTINRLLAAWWSELDNSEEIDQRNDQGSGPGMSFR
ncbi:hypothetical protein SAMN05216194_11712 [Stutzerimonas kunmingensis]|uniref:hypothetical protein n=1 Tax=Stutzerimonas kunmingensis TaxID=1211807 RepID=UPI0008E812E7|nr:hypothetical protein [Stutzerimonas kunmingensis]MCQ2045015.1 hypothetical protein [Stutzerimonas kunmingensis]SFK11225.1 hypothetical protein SAMN05216194_11712 [Stutzerimonas kunmingensis]